MSDPQRQEQRNRIGCLRRNGPTARASEGASESPRTSPHPYSEDGNPPVSERALRSRPSGRLLMNRPTLHVGAAFVLSCAEPPGPTPEGVCRPRTEPTEHLKIGQEVAKQTGISNAKNESDRYHPTVLNIRDRIRESQLNEAHLGCHVRGNAKRWFFWICLRQSPITCACSA